MKEERSSLKKNAEGIWEKDGILFPFVAKISPDSCLKSPEFRGMFRPNTFVHYCLEKTFKEVIGDDKYIYLASITKMEDEDRAAYPIPLCMLDFSEKQKKEIMKAKHFPKKAFEKQKSKIKEDFPSDEISFEIDEAMFAEEAQYEIDSVCL